MCNRSESTHSEPQSLLNSTNFSREFFTAKPTPCSPTSPVPFPYQKQNGVISFAKSLWVWEFHFLECCNVNLESKQFIVVCVADFWRSSNQPLVMVLYVPTKKPECWSLLCLLFLFVVVFFLYNVHSSQFRMLVSLSSTHPVKQVGCDGTTPNWLWTAQHEADGSCPVKCNGLSLRRK